MKWLIWDSGTHASTRHRNSREVTASVRHRRNSYEVTASMSHRISYEVTASMRPSRNSHEVTASMRHRTSYEVTASMRHSTNSRETAISTRKELHLAPAKQGSYTDADEARAEPLWCGHRLNIKVRNVWDWRKHPHINRVNDLVNQYTIQKWAPYELHD